jgi:hypothetical protein
MSFWIRPIILLALAGVATPAVAGDVSVRLDAGAGFSVRDNTGAVERLRVDEATGNVSRNGALFVHTTGPSNTFVGVGAGPATTGGDNTAFGHSAMFYNITGTKNAAFGSFALYYHEYGEGNSAFGAGALRYNSRSFVSGFGVGVLAYNRGNGNSAFGAYAANANTLGFGNAAFGHNALRSNTIGRNNAAFGTDALRYAITADSSAFGANALRDNTSGADNSAFGSQALRANTTGVLNSALGTNALRFNTVGSLNTAVGSASLAQNTTGSYGTAIGLNVLGANTTGSYNAAVGSRALESNTTGGNNLAFGWRAGRYQTTGNDNIYLANPGVAAETGQIKIGTVGTHTATTVAGIHGATSSGGIAVLVNASGVLGTTTSSARFKEDVRDMSEASDLLMRLHPVTFRYREDAVGAEESKTTQYGLLAEEVAEVAPELVAPDLEGKPYSVKYHVLPALLLAQNQAQERTIEELRARVAALEAERRAPAK